MSEIKEKKIRLRRKGERKKMSRVTRNLIIAVVVLSVIVGILGAALVLTDVELRKLSAQMTYMQDTVSVINSNLDNLGTNITAQLEEETSLVEDYQIKLKSINFETKTYTVDVTIVPKEFTESTETSVYFGTKEYRMDKDGFTYHTTATLPINESYEGNVTVLFTDGTKRTTEIIKYYHGIDIKGHDYITCTGETEQSISKEGLLSEKSNLNIKVDGAQLFSFEEISYVVSVNGTEVYTYNLLEEYEKKQAAEADTDEPEAGPEPETETQTEDAEFETEPVDTMEQQFALEYKLEKPLEDLDRVSTMVRLKTTDGYIMTYDISNSTITAAVNAEKPEDPPTYAVTKDEITRLLFIFYDSNGGTYRKTVAIH
ncbi:hypothetical protein [Agathobacter ruminis]|uniref:Uncharacterized protein n=1 Tax=Agathobacter ruminis TaxID=1712665 RepID=A0A2G3E296_9FIRM|nr:hypothetical protein [Agathobacter ruminis]MDC7301200.1 hypothetical protein [Agathobacter ruminis]PHU37341.1 hypothetical protein CSX02_08395 [Agathobacter ruminis]